jgi:hypothetical protein
MRAYVIDSTNETVTEATYNGNHTEIYKLGSFDTFDVVTFNEYGDTVFVDDNGLIIEEYPRFFKIEGTYNPLAGNGVVLGLDRETGDSVDPKISLKELQKLVSFGLPVRLGGDLL